MRKHEGTLSIHPHVCPPYARIPIYTFVYAYAVFNIDVRMHVKHEQTEQSMKNGRKKESFKKNRCE